MEEGKIVPKLWGEEQYITNTSRYCAKFLHVQPHYVCSEHMHRVKDETFHVIAGEGVILVGGRVLSVTAGDTVHVPVRTYHCFATATGMTLLEISTHHSDEDVERLSESHRINFLQDSIVCHALGITG